jgi:hypothetical protein
MITKLIQRIFRRSPRAKLTQSPAAGAPKRISKKAHRIDPQLLSKNAVKVTHTLQQAGHQAYIVGGAVRDRLLGLPVITDAGEAVGTVLAIENFGATDIIEITREPPPEKGTKTFMVPMIPTAVIEWDAERLVIGAAFAEDKGNAASGEDPGTGVLAGTAWQTVHALRRKDSGSSDGGGGCGDGFPALSGRYDEA